jgi:hypothetical protein
MSYQLAAVQCRKDLLVELVELYLVSGGAGCAALGARREVAEAEDGQLDRRKHLEVIAGFDQLRNVPSAVQVGLDGLGDP